MEVLKKRTLFLNKINDIPFADHLAIYPDSFSEIKQVGGCVKSNLIAGFLKYGCQNVRAGTLAIGSCYMYGLEILMGMSEMLIKKMSVFQSLFICSLSYILEQWCTLIKVFDSLLIGHGLFKI